MMLSHNVSRRREEGECLICYSMINYLLMGSHTEPPIATNDQLTYSSNQDSAQSPPLSVSKSNPNCELGRNRGFISE